MSKQGLTLHSFRGDPQTKGYHDLVPATMTPSISFVGQVRRVIERHGSDGKHVMFFVDLNVYSGNFHDCPAEYTHFTIAVDMRPGPRWQNFWIARLTGTVFVSGE